jgi:hypothetical protein
MRVFRLSVVLGVLGVAVACGGRDATSVTATEPPLVAPGQGVHVTVSPAAVSMVIGDSVRLHAYVEGFTTTAGASQAVRWSVTPDSGQFTVSDSGVVTARCYPGGTAAVVATSVWDSTVAGAATVTAMSTLQSVVSLQTITAAATGQPADLNHITGTVNVVANIATSALPCYAATRADLVIRRAGNDTVVASLPLDSLASTHYQATLAFHSDAGVNGAPAFPNGAYAVRVVVAMTGGLPPQASSTINFTIAN